MEGKFQEKFALLQQMKKEKELKEAKARESQPFDIFAIAGVTLPNSTNSNGFNMTIRHDGPTPTGPTIGSVKRPRKDRTVAVITTTEESQQPSNVTLPELTSGAKTQDSAGATPKTRLKRSSLAAAREEILPSTVLDTSGRGRMLSDASTDLATPSESTTDERSALSRTATPPTPIASPRAESNSRRNSGSASPTKLLAKDMTHNVQSRSGSVDENEEMVVDMFGRSVPRSRHHSSDEGSDSENESSHPRRRRRTEDDFDRYRPTYRFGRYSSRSRSRSRSQSRSRSRSRSPGRRRYNRRSRSRSVSPYYPHFRDGEDRRRQGASRGRRGDKDERDRYSGDEMPVSHPGDETDPYLAASRYLDTAFYPTKIYVGNLPSSVSLTSLRTLFGPFGEIEDMNLVEGKDFGFVTYVETASAQQALVKMNGAMLDGTCIRVNRAKIPERNRRGFAGVAWMDEDGELARIEEEQHQQAAAIAGATLLSRPQSGVGSGGMVTLDETAATGRRSSLTFMSARPVHQLPIRPRSPKLPPKPTGGAVFPPAGLDPRAAMAGRGGGRQILRYDDL